MTAFEAITTRQAWYAAEKIGDHTGVQFAADGRFEKADGTRPFAGIVQYGCDAADQMITVVKGAFPAIAGDTIAAGDLVKPDSTAPGTFVPAASTDVAYGVALSGAAKDELFTLATLDVPFTVPSA